MKSIGIDIGSYCIKIVEINSSTRGYQIIQLYTKPLTIKPNVDNHFEVIEFLRETVSRYNPEDTQFIVGINQSKIATRIKNFPFYERRKISKALPLELEDEIPFSIDTAVFDYKLQYIENPNSELLAFAVKKDDILNTIQLMKDCGVRIDLISCEGAAFANIFERWQDPIGPKPTMAQPLLQEKDEAPPTRKVNLILEIGNKHTIVSTYESGRLIGIRTILWGGYFVAEQISKKYNLPLSEAHKELENKGFYLTKKQDVSSDAKAFSDLIAKATKDFIRELQISILEIKSEFNADISKMEICGGFSLIPGLCPFLTQHVEISCNRVNILDQFSQVYIEKSEINDARSSIAIGLALEGLKKPRNPAINFLKDEFATKEKKFGTFWINWADTIKMSFSIIVVLYVWAQLKIDFSDKLNQESQIALRAAAANTLGLGKKESTKPKILSKMNEYKTLAADFKSIETLYPMNSALDILKKVSETFPPRPNVNTKSSVFANVDLIQFNVNEDSVYLAGYVGSTREVDLINESLKSIALDGKLKKNPTTIPPFGNKIGFSFSFFVDRGLKK